MATTLQSLRFPFHPSIKPPNSHSFPSTTLHCSPKSITFKDSFLVTRNKRGFSSKASSSQYSPTVAENLGDVSIFTAAGDPVMFKDLWDQNQVSMVMFICKSFNLCRISYMFWSFWRNFNFFNLRLWFLVSTLWNIILIFCCVC
jgi:hypothetical protein